MTPSRRDWTERMILQWSARAAALRVDPAGCAGARAAAIETIVEDLRRQLPAIPEALADDVVALRRQLAQLQPYLHHASGVMINEAALLEPLRHRLRCRIAAMLGDPPPAAAEPSAPIIIAPPPEPVPFTSGPQLDLFFTPVPELTACCAH